MRESLILFALSFLVRWLFWLTGWGREDYSRSLYWRFSEGILQYRTLGFESQASTSPDPLYPLFLALARWLAFDQYAWVIALQIALCSIGCVYFYKLSLYLSQSRPTAILAALLYSFYPYYVRQAASISQVGFLTTLLIISVYYYVSSERLKGFSICGLGFGLAILARSAVLLVWLAGLIDLFIQRRYKKFLVIAGMTLIVLVPYSMRNYSLNRSWMPTRGGWNLIKGNCEYSDQVLPRHTVDLLNPYLFQMLEKERPDLLKANERERGRFFTQKAIEFMRRNPVRTLKLKCRNLFYLFYPRLVPFYKAGEKTRAFFEGAYLRVENPLRRSRIAEWSYSFSYGMIFVAAWLGCVVRKKEFDRERILGLLVFSITVVCVLYWPATRLRSPVDFVFMFYAACGLRAIFQRFK